MRKLVILITGAAGEIGHALIDRLASRGSTPIVTIDVKPLESELGGKVVRSIAGSILDRALLDAVQAEYAVDRVYHLAALLSTRAEFTPVTAHEVNVRGTLNMLEFAMTQTRSHGSPVRFFYPSSIAAYGIPAEATEPAGGWREHEYNRPLTMYGCNKLYCEQLGRYYAHHYKQLDAESHTGRIDFRALRFPGLISAVTLPSGGTSDYAPDMIHATAQGNPYACFVRSETRIPFMVMPDAIDAVLDLMQADASAVAQNVHNLAAFNPTAEQMRDLVLQGFPGAEITYDPDPKRQTIVDSWPSAVDDSAARSDWNFSARYDLDRAFGEYLIPTIAARYDR